MEGELEVAWKRIGDSGDGPFSLSRSGWKKEGILKWFGRAARWGGLKLGRGSVDQEPCVKNLSFVRRQGWRVISKVGGRWKGFSPEGGNPCSD